MDAVNFHNPMPDSNSLNPDSRPVDDPIGDIVDSPVAQPASSISVPAANDDSASNKRAAERLKVAGRAKAMTGAGILFEGKIVDISKTGVSVLMGDMPPTKKLVTLDCNIFHNGKPHVFQIKALTVYAILSSGRFKVGFQFEPNNPAAMKVIGQLSA